MYKVYENSVTGETIVTLQLLDGSKVNQFFNPMPDEKFEKLLITYVKNTNAFLHDVALDEECIFDYTNCSNDWQDNTNYFFGNYQGL